MLLSVWSSEGPVVAITSQKARGAFYTPFDLAAYLTEWAIRTPDDTVIEPSCGEAVFLETAWEHIQRRGYASGSSAASIFGYEIDEHACTAARSVIARIGAPAAVRNTDFFEVAPTSSADAVVGNPPYIRYQVFSGSAREKAQRAALAAGVQLDGLASSWAPFVVHAARFLKEDGRLALVLPAELLHVKYAAPVRRYLMQRFAKVTLVTFERLVFPSVTSEVLLLLAEGQGPTDSINLLQVADIEGLRNHHFTRRQWKPSRDDTKWSAALIAGESLDLYKEIMDCGDFSRLSDWGDVSLGAVSGNNGYFRMPQIKAIEHGLQHNDLVDVLPSNGKALRGFSYSKRAHQELKQSNEHTLLFYPTDGNSLSAAAQQYIDLGEQQGVHNAYKCETRNPWWRVPIPGKVADLFITYMNHDSPRLIANAASVHALNSVHGLTLRRNQKSLKLLLPIAALNSITALGAEVIGRSYGGGVLKVEPREAALLPVPSPTLIRKKSDELRAIEVSSGQLLRAGKHDDIRAQVDAVLFGSRNNTLEERLTKIRTAKNVLRSRRRERGKSGKKNARE